MSAPPDSPYDVPSSSRREHPLPSFFTRLWQLPFSPPLWQRCADLTFADVMLPLVLIAFGANVALGFVMIPRVKAGAYEVASYYDMHADPLLYQDGRFRLDGERIFHYADEQTTVLIDPERTVEDEGVSTPQFVTVRADEVTLKQPGRAREIYAVEDFSELLELLGPGPVVDGQRIRELADRWVPPVIMGSMAIGGTLIELVTCLLYALIAGLLIMLLRGQWLALEFAACYRIALATSASKVALGFILTAAGASTGVPGIFQWPALMTLLGLLALSRRSPQPGSTLSAP